MSKTIEDFKETRLGFERHGGVHHIYSQSGFFKDTPYRKIDLSIPFLSPWNTYKERSYNECVLHINSGDKKKKKSGLKNHHIKDLFTRITYKSIPILIYNDYTLFFHMPPQPTLFNVLSHDHPLPKAVPHPASPISANGILIQLLETLLSHSQLFALHHPQTPNSSASAFILQNIPLIYLLLSFSVITLV